MKISSLFFVFFLTGIVSYNTKCYSQSYDKVVPSSPQAYSLGQYADVPIGNATGVPEISVPVYTFSEGLASLPITLSYHASGIKVEQEATWVGLGWTLNAGGMISRSKLGIPDKIGGRGADPLLNRDQYSASDAYLYYSAMFSKSKDAEHDVFYYNFCGHSGKFVLDDFGNPVLLETTNIKIIPIANGGPVLGRIGGWEMIVEDGTKFFFGKNPNSTTGQADFIEMCTNFDPNNSEGYPSGWYLREVQYVNGQKIKFTYVEEEVRSSKSMVKVMQEYHVYTNEGAVKDKYRYEDIGFLSKRLTSIEGENTKVFFDAEKLRSDLSSTNSYALTKIRILTKNNVPIKNYEFTANYFQTSESDDYKIKRLRLDEIKELSTDGLTGQYWKFYYNPSMLPSKGSCAQDFFGYYNGKTGNTSLVPKINETVSVSGYCPDGTCGYGGTGGLPAINVNVGEANRLPDENSMKACLIDSIVYPTGGSAKYVFEPNSYNYIGNQEISTIKIGGGVRVKEIRNYYVNKSFLKTIYTYKMLDASDGFTETTKSSGVLNNNPRFYSFRTNYLGFRCAAVGIDWGAPILVVSATPACRLALTHGSPIGYRQVKVQKISGAVSDGCEVYEYSSGYEYPDLFNYYYPAYAFQLGGEYAYGQGLGNINGYKDQLYPNMAGMQGSITYEPQRGLLKKKSTYNSANLPVSRRTYYYLSKGTFLYNDYPYFQEAKWLEYAHCCCLISCGLSFKVTPVFNYTNQLTGVDYYDYYNNEAVHTKKVYTYDHNQVIKEASIDSKGNDIIKKYKYPLDYGNGVDVVIDRMKTDAIHILNPTIETQIWYKQDGSYKLTDGTITKFGSNYMPQEIYKLNASTPLSSSEFGENFDVQAPYLNLFSDNNIYYKEKVSLSYSENGIKNLCNVSKKDDITTSYLWGYNNQYPVAKIENATYSKVEAVVNVSNIQTLSNADNDHGIRGSATNEEKLRVALDALRNIAGAMVTTYTYDPLIGMTSQTDPNGITTYYEYDDFGRLQYVRDHDGNIVKLYQYNYKH
ncbi:hypothetical protein [Labilibaculum euxinus]